ncbi:MAG: hypothetical protein PHG85_06915 [Candidatus Altiarchaeota archaeon]|nr:hypothetical protein [Candidatus Altiarchaeota archaeon]
MESKGFFDENRWWVAFTVVVIAAGALALYAQGYFREEQDRISPQIYRDMELKLLFEGSEPKLVAYAPEARLSFLPTLVGDSVPKGDSIVLGYDEARMMAEDRDISASEALWGYSLEDFFGLPFNVAGTLRKTDSILDMVHYVTSERFRQLPPGQSIIIKLTPERMPKLFYMIDSGGTNWPSGIAYQEKVDGEIEPLYSQKTYVDIRMGGMDFKLAENKTYMPLVLGSKEAAMMEEERLFESPGDTLDNFFGKDVYIAGILAPTNTSLDMMHYTTAE